VSSELIHVGFDNYLTLDRVLAVASPASAPMKRMVQRAKEQHRAIDLTSGRRTKAVVVMQEEWVTLIAITPETFHSRVSSMKHAAAD
jgi:regulator of extracellular matrix RemA (YlzA/DUF370 family)